MRAGVFTGVDEPLVAEDVDILPPGDHDVVVDIGASGVCHTEAAILRRHLLMPAPSIFGHESGA